MRWLPSIAILVVFASFAHAEDKARAREAFRRGSQHYDLGELKPALEAFKEAYRAYEEPVFLFNIAQCHRQLGENQPALQMYKAYLRKSPDAPNRAEVSNVIAQLEKMAAQEQTAKTLAPQGTTQPGTGPPEAAATPRPKAEPPPPHDIKPTVVASQAPPAAPPPIYRRWWLWTAVAAVVAGAAISIGVGATRAPSTPTATTDLGTVRF